MGLRGKRLPTEATEGGNECIPLAYFYGSAILVSETNTDKTEHDRTLNLCTFNIMYYYYLHIYYSVNLLESLITDLISLADTEFLVYCILS